MKNFLSQYWKRSCIFSVFITLIIIVTTIVFLIGSYSGEDYVLIICSLIFILVFALLIRISLIMVRYTRIKDDKLAMYSYRNKIICEISLEQDVYYEIMLLTESTYTSLQCAVLSNERFDSYKEYGELKLATVCKSVDGNGRQIIMPYDDFTRSLIAQPNYFEIA